MKEERITHVGRNAYCIPVNEEASYDYTYSQLRGKAGAKEYPLYVKGIRDLWGNIYAENYSTEIAAVRVMVAGM